MKKLSRILIFIVLFFALEKAIRTQTNGFRLEKTASDFSQNPHWEVSDSNPTPDVLKKPFYFLDSGVQCYAFLSEDGSTVLKVFKHYHMWPSSKILRKLPLPKPLNRWRENILSKREHRINSIFSSALLAYQELPKETGVFHLNLNPTNTKYRPITLYDKIGIRHTVDLNTTPFLLQKKADLLFSYLENHPDETPNVIDSLFHCIKTRSHLGIANSDPALYKNFGVCNGKVIEIDIGSFFENPFIKNSLYLKRELFYETLEFKEWIKDHIPEMNGYFEEQLLQAIRT